MRLQYPHVSAECNGGMTPRQAIEDLPKNLAVYGGGMIRPHMEAVVAVLLNAADFPYSNRYWQQSNDRSVRKTEVKGQAGQRDRGRPRHDPPLGAVAAVAAGISRAGADMVCRVVPAVVSWGGVEVGRLVVALGRGLGVVFRLGPAEVAGAPAGWGGRVVPAGEASGRVGFPLPFPAGAGPRGGGGGPRLGRPGPPG